MQSMTEGTVSKKMTVLQLITGLGVGGAERVVMELARRLASYGCSCFIAVLNKDCSLMEQYDGRVDCKIISIGMRKNLWSFIKAAIGLITLVRRERVSLIHAHLFHALCLALICKMAVPRVKLVFTSHSTRGFSRLRRMLICITRPLRDADVLFMAGQHCEMNAAKTVVIPNGVQVGPIKSADTNGINTQRVFLFVGRLDPVKNPIALIRAFAAMREKKCALWVAGDGILRREVVREIESLGINDRVRLLGIRHDIHELIERADCFVMSSRWEGMPVAVLEAGAAALPVVAPPVGAIPTLLDDDCGYLVDVSELPRALDTVMNDYVEASRRGERLRNKIISKFGIDRVCRAHADLYRSLLSNWQTDADGQKPHVGSQ